MRNFFSTLEKNENYFYTLLFKKISKMPYFLRFPTIPQPPLVGYPFFFWTYYIPQPPLWDIYFFFGLIIYHNPPLWDTFYFNF